MQHVLHAWLLQVLSKLFDLISQTMPLLWTWWLFMCSWPGWSRYANVSINCADDHIRFSGIYFVKASSFLKCFSWIGSPVARGGAMPRQCPRASNLMTVIWLCLALCCVSEVICLEISSVEQSLTSLLRAPQLGSHSHFIGLWWQVAGLRGLVLVWLLFCVCVCVVIRKLSTPEFWRPGAHQRALCLAI